MTVTKDKNRIVYPGNGVMTLFDFDFFVNDPDTEIVVKTTDANDVETLLTLNVDYQISTVPVDEDGGTIRYPISGTPLPATDKISIERVVAETQGTVFSNQGAFLLAVIEASFDKLIHLVQQNSDRLDRAMLFGSASSQSGIQIPEPEGSAALGWNSAGTALVNMLALTSGTATSTFVDTLLARSNGADFMDGLGITTAAQTLLDDPSIADMLTTLTAAGTTVRNLFTKPQRFQTATPFDNTDIASGVLTLIGDGSYFVGTNTNAVTSMASQAQGSLIFIRHDAAATWTHDGDFIFGPRNASRTSVAGDVSIWYEYSTGKWLCLFWTEHQASATDPGIVELATNAEAAAGTDSTRALTPANVSSLVLAAGQIGQTQIASSAVGQAELKTGSANGSTVVSGNSTNTVALTGGLYTWYSTSSNYSSSNQPNFSTGAGDTAAGTLGLVNSHASTAVTFYIDENYVQASPPYGTEDGIIPLFPYVEIEKGTGKILSVSVSTEPTWAYHGPTDIRAKYYRNGKGFIDVPLIIAEIGQANYKARLVKAIKSGDRKQIQYLRHRRDTDPKVSVEISLDFKNSDMDICPHPWMYNSPRNSEFILLDPQGTEDLYDLHTSGENVAKLIRDGVVKIDNQPLKRKLPKGVTCYGFNL